LAIHWRIAPFLSLSLSHLRKIGSLAILEQQTNWVRIHAEMIALTFLQIDAGCILHFPNGSICILRFQILRATAIREIKKIFYAAKY